MESPHPPLAPLAGATVDPDEVARFDALGEDWWDPRGSMRPLHKLNPLRIAYIRDTALRHFRGRPDTQPLKGLFVLDIGCGGGILSEPLARLGAAVTGIDPAPRNIAIARAHAERQDLRIDYRVTTAEALLAEGARFDMVLAMEVVEHVADVDAFAAAACGLAKPGGLLIASTINRTLKSFALAIVGAEYVLRWLPKGTHAWEKFVTVRELTRSFRLGGVSVADRTGVVFDPLRKAWRLGRDMDVNYMIAGRKTG